MNTKQLFKNLFFTAALGVSAMANADHRDGHVNVTVGELSGRAEFGLTGDDDFHAKVSPDGSTFHEGYIIDRNTGDVTVCAATLYKKAVREEPPVPCTGC